MEDPRGGLPDLIPDKANYPVTDAVNAICAPLTDATLPEAFLASGQVIGDDQFARIVG